MISTPQRAQKGFSLVELMVGSTVGLLLIIAVLALLASNKRVYTESNHLLRLQENARFALEYLVDDLRHAHFFGSARWFDLAIDPSVGSLAVSNNCSGPAAAFDINNPVWGTSAQSANAIGCISDALVVSGLPSDVLVLKGVSPDPLLDVNDDGVIGQEDANGDSVINALDSLKVGMPYIASNTMQGTLFLAAADDDLNNVPSISTTGDYPHGAIWRYRFRAYYVRDANPGDDTPPTLARMRLTWTDDDGMSLTSEDLVEGVEAMRLLYGVDADGDGSADRFLPALSVTDWSQVIAARVHLLLRGMSPDLSYEDTKTYQIGDITVTATQGDGASQGASMKNFRRMVVEATINMRNSRFVRMGG